MYSYRGLDSHLWAIYHNDFKNLVTSLHYVVKRIDAGNLIFSQRIMVSKNTKIFALRALNTINCVNLVTKYLNLSKKNKTIKGKKINVLGRYYSSIPDILIKKCFQNFIKYKKNFI